MRVILFAAMLLLACAFTPAFAGVGPQVLSWDAAPTASPANLGVQ